MLFYVYVVYSTPSIILTVIIIPYIYYRQQIRWSDTINLVVFKVVNRTVPKTGSLELPYGAHSQLQNETFNKAPNTHISKTEWLCSYAKRQLKISVPNSRTKKEWFLNLDSYHVIPITNICTTG